MVGKSFQPFLFDAHGILVNRFIHTAQMDKSMGDTATIMWGLVFGSIGVGYFIYGKKQKQGIALFSGIALCALPYIVSNVLLMIIIGIALMVLPFYIKY